MAQVVILMGVAGSGKTTVGQALAARTGWTFADGDDYHPPENVAKMSAGVPLDDCDREPWLKRLRELIDSSLEAGNSLILAGSALRSRYRSVLRREGVYFVYLKGRAEDILPRLESRGAHYMKPGMLASQLAALEEPTGADVLVLDIRHSVAALSEQIVKHLEQETR